MGHFLFYLEENISFLIFRDSSSLLVNNFIHLDSCQGSEINSALVLKIEKLYDSFEEENVGRSGFPGRWDHVCAEPSVPHKGVLAYHGLSGSSDSLLSIVMT